MTAPASEKQVALIFTFFFYIFFITAACLWEIRRSPSYALRSAAPWPRWGLQKKPAACNKRACLVSSKTSKASNRASKRSLLLTIWGYVPWATSVCGLKVDGVSKRKAWRLQDGMRFVLVKQVIWPQKKKSLPLERGSVILLYMCPHTTTYVSSYLPLARGYVPPQLHPYHIYPSMQSARMQKPTLIILNKWIIK